MAFIDLSSGKVSVREVPRSWIKSFLGGRGIGSFLLYNLTGPETDPLSPDNVLIVSTGLLAGIPTASGRGQLTGKSPLTGLLGSANFGGHFAPELRFAGFDHLIVKGKAEKPVYIYVEDGTIEIRDASHLWGMDAIETQRAIKEDLGDYRVQSLVIGQAGENLVRFACVKAGVKSAGGRTGMGCLMGSKKLKAIVARGTMEIEPYDPEKLYELCMTLNENIRKTRFFKVMQAYGTMHIFSYTNTAGLVRAKNFQLNQMYPSDKIEAEAIAEYSIGHQGCYGCIIQCRHRYVVEVGGELIYDEGPEYTSQGAWGSMPYINDTKTILICNHLVNKYGLDTLETGNMIAWAIEIFEKGLIDESTTGGMKLRWGDPEVVVELIRKIAFREGFGDILAEGPRGAVEKLGPETKYYMMEIKGMSHLQTDDRAIPSFALGIAVATRGCDHLRSRPAIDLYGLPRDFLEKLFGGPVSSDYRSYEGKARMIWYMEREYAVVDSLGICKFYSHFLTPHGFYRDTFRPYKDFSDLIYYLTGIRIGESELELCGERIYTLERMYLVREGISRKDDYLPERWYKEPTPAGLPIARGRKIEREKFDEMLDQYYDLHGWDGNGVPKQETLEKLGLTEEGIKSLYEEAKAHG